MYVCGVMHVCVCDMQVCVLEAGWSTLKNARVSRMYVCVFCVSVLRVCVCVCVQVRV